MTTTKQYLSARQFKKWMDQMGFGTVAAANALGQKSRSIQRYLDGTRPVSKTVALAMAAVSGNLEAWRG